MKKLLFLMVALLTCVGVGAEDFEVDGIQYTTVDGGVQVTGYNSSYEGDLHLYGTVTYNDVTYSVVSIRDNAFCSCSSLTSIDDLSACTSIGYQAFYYCSSLTSIGDLSECTSIGGSAFVNCSSLTSIGNLSACTSIGYQAFYCCRSLTSIGDLSACTSIGGYAFTYCSSLTSIGDLSACTSIGESAFAGTSIETITLPATPPSLTNSNISNSYTTFLVPADAVETYRAADYWKDIKMQIISKDAQREWDVETPVLNTIGASQFENVMSLKLSGNIDSDDIMYIRNKMFNLHHLDLKDANFIDSDKEYMSGASTHADKVGGFRSLNQLLSIVLPTSAKAIEANAFNSCYTLKAVTIQEGVESIGSYAFQNCSALKSIGLPSSLKSIGRSAFYSCSNMSSLSFPPGLITIESQAFEDNNLSEIRIPSSVESIGASAFIGNPNLKDVYAYTAEPININTNTFSNYGAATLHVFQMENDEIFNNYYADPQWGQFPSIVNFTDEYKYFYLNNDMTLESRFTDEPDFNGKPGSTIEVVGDGDQEFDDIVLDYASDKGASVIADENVKAKTITFRLPITGNRWYFYSFPFRVYLNKVDAPGTYVFRCYNGERRASGSASGWAALDPGTEYLEPGVGYIFQCNKSGQLKITVDNPDFYWHGNVKKNLLAAYNSANSQDANWNFVGNPMTNYYDIDDMSYEAPLTIWDGSKYVAYRPGDDNYQLSPFEAFFVQKPDDVDGPQYEKENRMGYNKAKEKKANKANAQSKSISSVQSSRMLVNLTLSNGEQEDQTRVVFNEKKTNAYEMDCDAAKFMSTEQVPQFYSVGSNVRYAINERQQGSVQLGFTAPKAGTYTIGAARMDQNVVLRDQLMGTTHELANGEYTFDSEAGTFENRFMLMPAGGVTAVESVEAYDGKNASPAYTLDGKLLPEGQQQKGIVVTEGKKVMR